MSLLTIIQNVAEFQGLTSPNVVIGSTDAQIIQLLQIANREGVALAGRKSTWQAMVRENTFTLTATENQGAMNGTVITDSDFDYIINDTIWNRTQIIPILGPLNSQEYQYRQALSITGPFPRYRILNGDLLIDPAPSNSTDTAAFEYQSTSWCQSAAGAGQAKWAADNDVGLLNEGLMELGITWRWKSLKGLDYQEDFAEYESQVANAITRDGGKPVLNSQGSPTSSWPGIFIPIGNWLQ